MLQNTLICKAQALIMEQEREIQPYNIIWRGSYVGTISETVRDMWLMDGMWTANDTETAVEFERIARSCNPKIVYDDWSKGMHVIIEIPGSVVAQIHSIVLGMEENVLMLRNVFDREAVKWVLKNVR